MKVFKLVILLATLSLLFALSYFFFYTENPESTAYDKHSLNSLKKMPAISSAPNKKDKENKTLLSEHRFERKNFSQNDQNTKILNSIDYFFFSPPKPWPENLKFPLIVHLNDHNDLAYSAEYISQDNMTFHFPAFSIVPQTDQLYAHLNIDERMKKTNNPFNATVNDNKTVKSAVNFKTFREHTKKILPPLTALIDNVKEKYPIDEKRIYLIGCGFGAATLFHLIEKQPDRFASLVALSGTWQSENYNKFKSTPILTLNGKINAMFLNISGESFTANVKKAGGKAIYKGFESMPHTCSHKDFYASNVWKWMFAQKRQ